MVLPGHIAAGYLTSVAVINFAAPAIGLDLNVLSSAQVLALYAAGTLLGDGPDIDVFFGFLAKKTLSPQALDGHRDYFTHTPLVWLCAGAIVFGAGFIAASVFLQILGLLIWLSPWSHFLCDSIEYGVKWLRPFSQKRFALFPGKDGHAHDWKKLFSEYFKTPVAYAEIAVVMAAGFVIIFQNLL